MIAPEDLARLTNPRTVAVVGASNKVGSYGWRVLNIMKSFGATEGRSVFVVNPAYAGQEIQQIKAHASLLDLPESPDCTLVIAPAPAVPRVLAEMAAVGGRCGVVLSAQHGSSHTTARQFDLEVSNVARQHDLVLIGPNSMGFISPATTFAGTFASGMLSRPGDENPAPAGSVAMISQSGAAISYLIEAHRGARVGYSHLFSTGNEAVVGFNDLLEALVEDPATESIVLFVETIHDGQRTRRAIARARERDKAVVLMKIGNSDAGRAAAQSHSGRIAGEAAPYQALAADLGVITVSGYEQLFDTVRLLSAIPAEKRRRPTRGRAAIITTSGGAAVVGIDELAARGWSVPSLSAPTRRALDAALGREGHDNPLDLLDLWRDESRIPTTLRILDESGELDAVFIALGGGGPAAARVVTTAAAQARELDLTVMFAGIGLRAEAQRALNDAGAAFLPDLRRAVVGLTSVVPAPPAGSPERRPPGAVGKESSAGVPSGEVLNRLALAGVRCVPSHVVDLNDAAAVTAAAAALGWPVVAKLEHERLLHKSDLGAVVVDIRDEDELDRARARLAGIAERSELDGATLVLQRMVRGVEVLVGARRDPSFGHLLVVGLGGTLAELIDDVRVAFLPASRERIAEMLCGHARLMTLLDGYRGNDRADFEDLVTQIHRIAEWVGEHAETIVEFDVNPLTVAADGAYVVDARVIYAEERRA